MYYHNKGFYSTEPAIGDYLGTYRDYFMLDNEVGCYQPQTDQEKKNHTSCIIENKPITRKHVLIVLFFSDGTGGNTLLR